jgi:predicted RNase H-like nuclease (RuvC/YqgF family)
MEIIDEDGDKLRETWNKASKYPLPSDIDVNWTPANHYVSMLERKVIEQNKDIEILQEKIKALDKVRKLWANGEIEN